MIAPSGGQFTPRMMRHALYDQELQLEVLNFVPGSFRIRKFRSGFGRKLRATKKIQMLCGGMTRRKLLRTYERAQRIAHPSKYWKLLMAMEGSAGGRLTG